MKQPLFAEVSVLAVDRQVTGIARFTARLVEALSRRTPLRLVSVTPEAAAVLGQLCTALLSGQEISLEQGALPPIGTDLPRWVRRLIYLPHHRHDAELAAERPGLFTALRSGDRHFGREVGIFYDFTPVLLPWAHSPMTRSSFGHFFGEQSQLYDKVVAISRSTQSDARWLTPVPPDDVVACYPGPSLCVHSHAHPEPVARHPRAILVVSTLEPRKNGPFLLDWFLDTTTLDPGTELWWVGPKGWWSSRKWLADLRKRVQQCKKAGRRIRFLGQVSDARLCELYQQATFSIYPSLYEGFGFPVLDSLWHGTPVVCSCNSSLKEFEGPGVYYFDACDPATLDDACRELLASPGAIAGRTDLHERFSWDTLARTVLALCA